MNLTTEFSLWLLAQNIPYVQHSGEYGQYMFNDDEEAYKSDEKSEGFHIESPDWFPISLYGQVKRTQEQALASFGEAIFEARQQLLNNLNLVHAGTVRLEPKQEETPEVPEGVKEIFGEPTTAAE